MQNGLWMSTIHGRKSVAGDVEAEVERYFNNTGTTIISFLGLGGIAFGVIIGILGFMSKLHNGKFAIAGGVFLVIFSVLMMKLDDDKFEQWTPEVV